MKGYRAIKWVQELDPTRKTKGETETQGLKEYDEDILSINNCIYAMCREDWSFVTMSGRFFHWGKNDMAAMAAS